jgi:hypothetical protein
MDLNQGMLSDRGPNGGFSPPTGPIKSGVAIHEMGIVPSCKEGEK